MALIFPELHEPLQVWRYGTPTSGWGDPTFVLVGTVMALIEPVSGKEEFLNKQDYQGVSEIASMDIIYDGVVQPDDYLVDTRGTQYVNKGVPETWRHIIPHVYLKLERSQEPVTFPVVPST